LNSFFRNDVCYGNRPLSEVSPQESCWLGLAIKAVWIAGALNTVLKFLAGAASTQFSSTCPSFKKCRSECCSNTSDREYCQGAGAINRVRQEMA
jgi:hypothetical protein